MFPSKKCVPATAPGSWFLQDHSCVLHFGEVPSATVEVKGLCQTGTEVVKCETKKKFPEFPYLRYWCYLLLGGNATLKTADYERMVGSPGEGCLPTAPLSGRAAVQPTGKPAGEHVPFWKWP